ncbi:aminoacyl-histidine dipeptidase [Spirochaeta isovalerica]|uniref:Cytosol non-specific dipeptidase n=1 Tax=Spirochaeta isovalerica TaxID=150 RepID=A0A841R3L7_9SPIO|nr:aminoacyl-histidine dipeptidase [Spirochaeta isovalerica]MBB6479664.1 dipeptidase D [Spirochaeta isovalerica]
MTEAVQRILDIFEELNKVPRQSEQEEKIHKWLMEWAEDNGFACSTDEALNINIKVPATPGFEKAPGLVIQGHMDMVCEKVDGSDHDFSKDPIKHVIDGEWLTAEDTSLGADNGIAIAMAFAAALDKDLEHPAFEILITTAEETGLYGANALKPGFVEGKILLNLDSEDEGIFTVGCAGGNNTIIHLPVEYRNIPEGHKTVQMTVTGLLGGHSGVDINTNRESSNVLISRLVSQVLSQVDAGLVDIYGGTAHNSIARTSDAVLAVKVADLDKLETVVREVEARFKVENSLVDKGLEIKTATPSVTYSRMLTAESQAKTVNLLLSMPHGVQRMSAAIEGLVQTSNNLAIMKLEGDNLYVLQSQRSSVMSDLMYTSRKIEAIAGLAGARVEIEEKYPAWMPDMDSPLLQKCREVYIKTFGKEPVIEAIHAGLECGVIGSIYEGMDMISFGPDIQDCHSPDEKLRIPSLELVWLFLTELFKSYRS